MFRIPFALHGDLRGGAFDLAKVVRRELHVCCSDVLLEAFQFRGAWEGNDPWLLREQPRERDLSRRRLLPFSDRTNEVDHRLIRFASFRREARDDVSEVGVVERGLLVDFSRQEPLPEGAEWNETDSELPPQVL